MKESITNDSKTAKAIKIARTVNQIFFFIVLLVVKEVWDLSFRLTLFLAYFGC